jgi:class 3 adenylate cyclase/CHASE2 domain-containing sensor protein
MSRLRRTVLINCLLLGAGLTTLTALLSAFGALAAPEVWLYDRRARLCQHFTPAPTDKLVHLDLDDEALATIGRWPWPRSVWPAILDEISRAGPAAIEMDFIFPDRQDSTASQGTSSTHDSDDAQLAAAIGRAGNLILGSSFDVPVRESPLVEAAFTALKADPHLDPQQLAARLGGQGTARASTLSPAEYLAARERAVHALIQQALDAGKDSAAARKTILGDADADLQSALSRLVDSQIEVVRAQRALARFGLPIPSNLPPGSIWHAKLAPIHDFSERAAGVAFVDYPTFEDGIIRSVPMLLQCDDGRAYVQMGLVLACRLLNVPIENIRVEPGNIVIRRSQLPDLRIPVRRSAVDSGGRTVILLMDVPWFGGRKWQTMYDFPARKKTTAHFSLLLPWSVADTRRKIAHNLAAADDALRGLLAVLDRRKYDAFVRNPPTDPQARMALVRATIEDARPLIGPQDPNQPADEDQEKFVRSFRALENVQAQDSALRQQLKDKEAELASAVKGRAALIGFAAATAAYADVIPTSLHDKCPGVVVHGVVFNGIMTGEMWRRAPAWLSIFAIILLGILTAAATGYLSPLPAAFSALALGAAYALINGFVLFDYGNLIVDASGPLLAVMLVWGGCTVWRFLFEANERARVTRRFQRYVDPALQNYYLEHPEQLALKGEVREMTVVFTDLAGFTGRSEQFGERIVSMLNEFMGLMVPLIRKHRGYVNKFLGDGIMFFFGAPESNPNHAIDAVAALRDMQTAVTEFSQRLQERSMPPVLMRAGVTSGVMVVGDAGSADASDYTVIGDNVNLASRLESANKATGTLTLISQRTAELVRDTFLLRPVGSLVVVGRTEGERAFEVLAPLSAATDPQRKLAAATTDMIDHFLTGRFADCLEHCEQMDAAFGSSRLVETYRELCLQYLREPPANFKGVIVLTEK